MVYINGKFYRVYDRSLKRPLIEPRKINGSKNSKGYVKITLNMNGEEIDCFEHRLIWMYFNGEIPEGMEVNHIDGVKDNNNIDNLELLTPQKNSQHAMIFGLRKRNKLTSNDVLEIKKLLITTSLTMREISKIFGVSRDTIKDIKQGKTWSYVTL